MHTVSTHRHTHTERMQMAPAQGLFVTHEHTLAVSLIRQTCTFSAVHIGLP